MSSTITPRFDLGQLAATPAALAAISAASQAPLEFVTRHARLEQGELTDGDHQENLFSVDKHLRIFSAFNTDAGAKVWIITEAGRSTTTILLPEEY
jgi:hypothetical protein